MEERIANMMFNETGAGSVTTRITIPVPWARKMGFTKLDRKALILFDGNRILIKKS